MVYDGQSQYFDVVWNQSVIFWGVELAFENFVDS